MSRRKGAIFVLWICGLSICALWRPVRAGEKISAGREEAKRQLGDLEAARDALDSAERGKAEVHERGNSTILKAHKELIDFEVKQQKELAGRETELQEARGQIAALKAEVEKLQAAAKQREGELAERTKERDALQTKSREELASMRSQLEKLEASIAGERKDREKTLADAKRLEGEKQKLEAELNQIANAREAAPAQRSKGKDAEKVAGGEQLSALHSQVEKLEASIGEERKEREKAQDEVKRLEEERKTLQAQLEQTKAPEQAEKKEEAVSQQRGTGADVSPIKKWQKTDGSLFFGERPPPGSKLLGEVENLGTSGGGDSQATTSSQ